MKTLHRLLAALAVLAVALFTTTAVGAQGVPEGWEEPSYTHAWAISPAGSLDPNQPGNRSNMTYDAAPGTTIEDAITVSNYGNVQLNFRIYGTDAVNTSEGTVDLLPGNEAPTDVGSWVQIAQEDLTLPPDTAVTVPITITIPPDARPGDHVGAFVASSPAPARGPDGSLVPLDRRTSTRLNVRVAGPLEPRLEVQDLSVSYTPGLNPLGGEATVSYRIQNSGNVRSEGSYSVSAGGPFGLLESTSDTFELSELLPGQGVDVTTTILGVPASVVATAAVHVTPTPIVGDTQAAEGVSAEARAFAVPFSLLALGLVLALVLFAVRRFRSHGESGGGSGAGPSGPNVTPGGRADGRPRPGTAVDEPVLEGQRS